MPRLAAAKPHPSKADGVWVEHVLGFRYKIKHRPNAEYAKIRRKRMQGKLKKLRTADLKTSDEIEKYATAFGVVVDWAEHLDDNDNAIPFSHEACYDLFLDPEWEEIYTWLGAEADDLDNFEEDEEGKEISPTD